MTRPSPWGPLAVADAHVHFFSHDFFAALVSQKPGLTLEAAGSQLGWQLPPHEPEKLAAAWVHELDRYGVSASALMASVPGDEGSVIAAARAFPTRFFAYAMVNPRALNAGLPGLCSPFDMRFSNPVDLHAVALRYPEVPMIVPHFGAGYFREALMLADQCSNVYLDTSSSNHWMRYQAGHLTLREVFRHALEVAGPRRLLFGTDSSFFPRGWQHGIFEDQARALYEIGTSEADAGAIFGENLLRILAA
jgi:predicted TIM-barrel fold metal-dependent hydrolase